MMIVAQQNGANIASNISNSSSNISNINKSSNNSNKNSKSNCDNLKFERGEKRQQLETSNICPGRPNQIIFRQKLAQLRGVAAGGVRLQLLFLIMICSCIGKFGKIKWVSVSVYVRWLIDNYRYV